MFLLTNTASAETSEMTAAARIGADLGRQIRTALLELLTRVLLAGEPWLQAAITPRTEMSQISRRIG